MTYYYTGSIQLRNFENQFSISDLLGDGFHATRLPNGKTCIDADFEPRGDISCDLENLAAQCEKHGIEIEDGSCLDYSGDGEGRYVYRAEDNTWDDISRHEAELMDAADEDLVEQVLERESGKGPSVLWQLILKRISAAGDEKTVITDGDEILCDYRGNGEKANAIADFLDTLIGENATVTGYYDPKEDLEAGMCDRYTGWWYVRLNQ